MSDKSNEFVSLLDKLLPFLEASPTWFKIWIYVLMALIFITMSGTVIFYLMHQGKFSPTYFSVEHPIDKEDIPLGENKSCILEGTFPLIKNNDKITKTAEIKVEVIALPNRDEVQQQSEPRVRISTDEGKWIYDSAIFKGEGLHEIWVTALLDGSRNFKRLSVNCVSKATSYENSIANIREIRGAPKLVLAEPSEISLPDIYRELDELEVKFFKYYPSDMQQARKILFTTFDKLDRVLPLFPDDLFLQNKQAYWLKNYAMILRDSNRHEDFLRTLKEAERMFRAIREQDPKDAGAWNGLGSVEALRGKYKEALYYIKRALEINPTYEAALEDRKTVLKYMK